MSEAQTYYDGLITQGHTPDSATQYTQQYYPGFVPGMAAPAPAPAPMGAPAPAPAMGAPAPAPAMGAPAPAAAGGMAINMGSVGAGVAPVAMQQGMGSDKDWTTTLILGLVGLLGISGIDRFYTGSVGLGILKLLTFGGCGIWFLIDLIMLVTGSYKDGNGMPVVK